MTSKSGLQAHFETEKKQTEEIDGLHWRDSGCSNVIIDEAILSLLEEDV